MAFFSTDLQHVHHLLELSRLNPGSVLHGKALEILNQDEAINLGLFILKQLLQDHTVCS